MLILAPSVAHADVRDVAGWTLNTQDKACLLFASFDRNTTISLYATDTKTILYTLQNPHWNSLTEQGEYKLNVEFDSRGAWPVTALSTRKLDDDGPGVSFLKQIATNSDGDNFLAEFAVSKTMRVDGQNGRRITNLNLTGTYAATMAFVDCLRRFNHTTSDPFAAIKPEVADPFVKDGI
jgi:hypothetical protein